MESFPSTPQENPTLHQENILLEGPDGFRFTVQKTINSPTELAQTQDVEPQMDLAPNSELATTPESAESVIGMAEPSDGEIIPINLDKPIKVGLLATAGLGIALAVRRHRNNPSRFAGGGSRAQQSANRRARDTENHRTGARVELDRHQTGDKRRADRALGVDNQYPKSNDPESTPEINYTKRFNSAHRIRRLEDPINHDSFIPIKAEAGRTRVQEKSSLRANLRGDASRKRIAQIDVLRELYGPAILSDDALQRELAYGETSIAIAQRELDAGRINQDTFDEIANTAGNYSRSQRKAIQRAGKKVRKLQKSDARIQGRLASQANGTDIPGRVSGANRTLHRD